MSNKTAWPDVPFRKTRYGVLAFWIGVWLAANLILRIVLFAAFKTETPAGIGTVLQTFAIGLLRDLYVAVITAIPLLIWFLLVPNRLFGKLWNRLLLISAVFLFWTIQIFLWVAEYYFFEEFRSRFNTVSVDYLMYYHEVFVNIWEFYPVTQAAIACLLAGAAITYAGLKFSQGLWQMPVPARRRLSLFAGALVFVALLSSSMGLKGPRFSQDRMLNEYANNGALAFVAAAWTHNLEYSAFYKTIPLDEAYQRSRKLLADTNLTFVGIERELKRNITGDANRPKLNVVLFLEESLGSEFWGSLGRKEATCTPVMDKLALEEGLFFTNIYASGNRTVRGFEGVLSSFPPLPGDSIVKRDMSENVETIARILKRDSYNTLFVYGGRGFLDGMRSFAVDNGYDRFIEQKHFEKPTFTSAWGVCDEDIYNRTLAELRDLAAQGKPFFTTILSVSNHKPYTYPAGRIPEDPNEKKRENAVKYSDFALGQFFKGAKREPYWTNTIFVVVADHGARVYGSLSIPIGSYEIPLVILGPAVVKQPIKYGMLGGSLDVAPTVLGLLGRPYESLFFGRDLLHGSPDRQRIFINHNRDIGMMAHEQMVVLGLRKGVEYYQGNPKVELKALAQPRPEDLDMERDTEALYQVADDLYTHRRYHLDPK